MIKNIFVVFVMCVTVISADEKSPKYTNVILPAASRQSPTTNELYQSDALYPQQTGPYQMSYQPSNEGIYPPASEDINDETQAQQPEQV